MDFQTQFNTLVTINRIARRAASSGLITRSAVFMFSNTHSVKDAGAGYTGLELFTDWYLLHFFECARMNQHELKALEKIENTTDFVWADSKTRTVPIVFDFSARTFTFATPMSSSTVYKNLTVKQINEEFELYFEVPDVHA